MRSIAIQLIAIALLSGAPFRASAQTELISVAQNGTPGDSGSYTTANLIFVSNNGRFVVFSSNATNFAGDTDSELDLFLRDRTANQTFAIVDGGPLGISHSPEISRNGNFVVYAMNDDIKLYDRLGSGACPFIRTRLGSTYCLHAVDGTFEPATDAEGKRFAFQVHMLPSPDPGPVIGRLSPYVTPPLLELVSNRDCGDGCIFDNFPVPDPCGIDVANAAVLPPAFSSWGPAMDDSGHLVAFLATTDAINCNPQVPSWQQVFVKDMLNPGSLPVLMSQNGGQPANHQCEAVAISGNGRWIAFVSRATNLALGVTNGIKQIYVRDRLSNSIVCISRNGTNGAPGDNDSDNPTISANGRYVAYQTWARNLVPGPDPGDVVHIHRRDRDFDGNGIFEVPSPNALAAVRTLRVSVNNANQNADSHSDRPCISADGLNIAFSSGAGNLVPGAIGSHVYMRARIRN